MLIYYILPCLKMTGSWYVIASSNWEANRVDIRREDNSFVAVVFRKENGCVTKNSIFDIYVYRIKIGCFILKVKF